MTLVTAAPAAPDSAEEHPYNSVTWVRRDAMIGPDGAVFRQDGVEFPAGWTQNAVNITTEKYFRGEPGSPERESSLRHIIDRVVGSITRAGTEHGYFADTDEARSFERSLIGILLHQKASFNSPVWFNIGVAGEPQQCSACFILAVDDDLPSILNWYAEEGMIFKGGSGAGVNLSAIRASTETLRGGGRASGPISFMRGADASAGSIRSGGKTRRAAKMVVLDVDHPDIKDFVWCKALEERKAHALAAAGFDMGVNGVDTISLAYQNANNSVRLTDDFMDAAGRSEQWRLIERISGQVGGTVDAAGLLDEIAEAAWACADPGVQFDDTINRWHTTPRAGRINASNPCSEYMHLDNSACNLASMNLLAYLDGRTFDVASFRDDIRTVFRAQDILISFADYPTAAIAANTTTYRQIGLGYSNLGALLMTLGHPYDSPGGRSLAAAITAIMTGEAYGESARLAALLGPFGDWEQHRDDTLRVLRMHAGAVDAIAGGGDGLLGEAAATWQRTLDAAEAHGVRNAQATVLAPCGTIGFMMDCDTTGVEPDFALRKHKSLSGGGTMTIVNRSVEAALVNLGYGAADRAAILRHIENAGNVADCADLRGVDRSVFACATGPGAIDPRGHVDMMAAVQPFLSGAISKTVNMPESTTVAEVRELWVHAWRAGLKAVAIYRDNCKVAQPLSAATAPAAAAEPAAAPQKRELSRVRSGATMKFRVGDCTGYLSLGEFDDGDLGEMFLNISKQGSTLAGFADAFAISVSLGLQHGVPLATYANAMLGMRFEPAGVTDDADFRMASSLFDYIFRALALRYLDQETRIDRLGIRRTSERIDELAAGDAHSAGVHATPPRRRRQR